MQKHNTCRNTNTQVRKKAYTPTHARTYTQTDNRGNRKGIFRLARLHYFFANHSCYKLPRSEQREQKQINRGIRDTNRYDILLGPRSDSESKEITVIAAARGTRRSRLPPSVRVKRETRAAAGESVITAGRNKRGGGTRVRERIPPTNSALPPPLPSGREERGPKSEGGFPSVAAVLRANGGKASRGKRMPPRRYQNVTRRDLGGMPKSQQSAGRLRRSSRKAPDSAVEEPDTRMGTSWPLARSESTQPSPRT